MAPASSSPTVLFFVETPLASKVLRCFNRFSVLMTGVSVALNLPLTPAWFVLNNGKDGKGDIHCSGVVFKNCYDVKSGDERPGALPVRLAPV